MFCLIISTNYLEVFFFSPIFHAVHIFSCAKEPFSDMLKPFISYTVYFSLSCLVLSLVNLSILKNILLTLKISNLYKLMNINREAFCEVQVPLFKWRGKRDFNWCLDLLTSILVLFVTYQYNFQARALFIYEPSIVSALSCVQIYLWHFVYFTSRQINLIGWHRIILIP